MCVRARACVCACVHACVCVKGGGNLVVVETALEVGGATI